MRTLSNIARGRMQAMPRHVSLGCTSLVARALVRDVDRRITLRDMANDVWLRETAELVGTCGDMMAHIVFRQTYRHCPSSMTSVQWALQLLCVQGQQVVGRTATQQSGAVGNRTSPGARVQEAPGLPCKPADVAASAASSATGHFHTPSSASSDAGSSRAWRPWGGLCAAKAAPARDEAGGWTPRQRMMSIKRYLGFGAHSRSSTVEPITDRHHTE